MLTEVNMLGYWRHRAEEQQERTVGFAGQDMATQDELYAKRTEFLLKHCPTDRQTLDYGCGIGRYASLFPKYTGIDITEELIRIAKRRNPGKVFLHQKDPVPNFAGMNFDMFFTSTVLQHCAESVVDKILEAVAAVRSKSIVLCLYENSDKRVFATHVVGRSSESYRRIVSKFFDIKDWKTVSHIVHGEEHSLLVANV